MVFCLPTSYIHRYTFFLLLLFFGFWLLSLGGRSLVSRHTHTPTPSTTTTQNSCFFLPSPLIHVAYTQLWLLSSTSRVPTQLNSPHHVFIFPFSLSFSSHASSLGLLYYFPQLVGGGLSYLARDVVDVDWFFFLTIS